MVVGMSRRAIAKKLGHPDTSAGIPEARWVRAMTFERLVHHERFVSQLLTTAVGALGLEAAAMHRYLALPGTLHDEYVAKFKKNLAKLDK